MATVTNENLKVNSHLLLALYAIVPFSILLVLVDQLFLHGILKEHYLPSNPASLMLWAIIFNFPHIVSSMVTLADDEYLAFYKARFTKALVMIVSGVLFVTILAPLIFPKMIASVVFFLFFTFFAAYTMYHVLSQQFGIGMMLMKVRPTKSYEVWRLLSTFTSTIMYAMVFIKPALVKLDFLGFGGLQLAEFFAGLFLIPSILQGMYLAKDSQRQLGTYYVYSNLFMLSVTYVLLVMGYDFFVIALPRFVHDLTAFIIYSTHDQNRNRDVIRNHIYRALKFLPIPILILCPILAMFLAHSIQCGSFYIDIFLGFDKVAAQFNECPITRYYEPTGISNGIPASMQVWMQIMFICGLFHYHIEAFVWKREAIHRHAVSFT